MKILQFTNIYKHNYINIKHINKGHVYLSKPKQNPNATVIHKSPQKKKNLILFMEKERL